MPAEPETSLIERARAGDAAAFERLIDNARADLLAYFMRVTGSAERARDLLQETLLLAWRGLGSFRQEAQLRTWVFRIARNCLASACRREPEQATLSLEALAEDEASPWVPGDTAPPLAEVFARAEFAHFLMEAARACCEPNEYLVLMLAYRGLEVAEIAPILRLNENHVRVLTFRARGKLLAHLFCQVPDAVGGRAALAEAFNRARPDLSPAEAEVFRRAVLEGQPPARSAERLRAACLKVARHLRGL